MVKEPLRVELYCKMLYSDVKNYFLGLKDILDLGEDPTKFHSIVPFDCSGTFLWYRRSTGTLVHVATDDFLEDAYLLIETPTKETLNKELSELERGANLKLCIDRD
jgi:hypothetical protein